MTSESSLNACAGFGRLKKRIVELDSVKCAGCCSSAESVAENDSSASSLIAILGQDTLKNLQDHFAQAIGLSNALVDPHGTLLTSGGKWNPFCFDLVRKKPEGLLRCKHHIQKTQEKARQNSMVVNACHTGLLDAAAPVVVQGEIKGYLMTGQVLDAPPDREQAMAYARELGIPPEVYWKRLCAVPIVPRERVEAGARLLQFFANELADKAVTSMQLRQEIAQRKKVEEELRVANLRQTAILDAIPGYVCFVDNNFRLRDLNKALYTSVGFKDKQSAIGRPCYEIFSQFSAPCPYCVVPQSLATGKAVVRDSCGGDCLPGGKKYRFYVAPVKDTAGEIVGAVEAIMDITDLDQAQKALKQSENKYFELYSLVRLMADNVPDLIWAKDMNNNFLFANKAICDKLLKCDSTDEPLGRSDIFYARRERVNGYKHTFGEICVNSDAVVKETKKSGRFLEDGLVRGEYLALDVHKAPFYAPDGVMIGTVGAGRVVTEDIGLQKALEESEKRYRLLAENVRDVIWTMDENMRMTYASPSMVNLTGYTAEEMTTLPQDGRLTRQVSATFLQNAKRQLEKGGQETFRNWEFEWCRRDGGKVWIETTTAALRDDCGRPTCIIGVSRDVTDRKRFEHALTLSEERSRALLEAIPDMMIVVDDMGKIVKFKRGISQRYVSGMEDITGLLLEEALPGRILDKAALHLDRTRKTGCMQVFEFQQPSTEEGVRDYEVRLVRCSDNEVLAIVRDMTEQRRAETALYEANQRLRLAMVSANQGKWECDFSKQSIELDENAAHMLGFEPGEITGAFEWWKQRIHPEDYQTVRTSLEDCFFGRVKYFTCEYRIRKKDGDYIWVAGNGCVTRRDEKGAPVLFIGTHRNINQRIESQVELEQVKEIALAANRSKTKFLANMSHDVRTPLNGILGMLQLLAATDLSPTQQDFADTALDSCLRLVRLLSDIVDIAKIEAGKLSVREAPFNIRQLVKSVRELLRTGIMKKKLEFVTYVDERIPEMLVGDEGRVRQILFNLVGNAIKYTDQGKVQLELFPLPMEKKDRMRLLVSVTDTGIGIPENMLDSIFDTFIRDAGAYVQHVEGSGLGLYIVQQLAQLLGGEVSLASKEGMGTEVHFCLPFGLPDKDAPVPLPEKNSGGIAALPKGVRILLAEDDFANRLALEGLLVKLGCEVVCVQDGAEALDQLQAQNFDCVLMDIQMPVMDGVLAVRAIRNDVRFKHAAAIPVVAMTAYAMKGDKERFLKEGMTDYLSKPVQLKDLVAVLHAVLPLPAETKKNSTD